MIPYTFINSSVKVYEVDWSDKSKFKPKRKPHAVETDVFMVSQWRSR